jgi:hypothetical protein
VDDERRGHASRGRIPGAGDPPSGDFETVESVDSVASIEPLVELGPAVIDRPAATLMLSTLEGRSPYVTTCPFLRAALDDGSLDIPQEEPDYANRCAAFGDAKPQSLRQQELVCLTSGHAECPRYLRGAVVTHEQLTTPAEGRRVSRPIVAAVGFLVLSVAASLGFVFARGGLDLPSGSSATNGVAGAIGSPTPGPTLVAAPLTPAPTLSPTPSRTPSPTPRPTPRPTPPPTPTPEPTPEPRPTSERYQYLTPCPSTPDCFIYVIHAGDALYNLANYFGHSLETVYRLNPWARNGIRPGDQLILPPPTR